MYFTDTVICTCCCAALDHVVTYLFRIGSRTPGLTNGTISVTSVNTTKRQRDEVDRNRDQHFLQVMMERPDILRQVSGTILVHNTMGFSGCL